MTLLISNCRWFGELCKDNAVVSMAGFKNLVWDEYILPNVINCLVFSVYKNIRKKLIL